VRERTEVQEMLWPVRPHARGKAAHQAWSRRCAAGPRATPRLRQFHGVHVGLPIRLHDCRPWESPLSQVEDGWIKARIEEQATHRRRPLRLGFHRGTMRWKHAGRNRALVTAVTRLPAGFGESIDRSELCLIVPNCARSRAHHAHHAHHTEVA
jgi:hypothetical protein